MQPEGPYRFTELVGECPVGKAWSAEDEYGRMLTVAILDPAVAGDPRWRQAFEVAANTMAQPQSGDMPYVNADFAAQQPWVAYSVGRGPGAERLFQSLGMDFLRTPSSEPAAPSAGVPASGGVTTPVGGPPPGQPPAGPAEQPPVSAPPGSGAPVSGASGPPDPIRYQQPSPVSVQRETNPISGSPLASWGTATATAGSPPAPSSTVAPSGRRFPDTSQSHSASRFVVAALVLLLVAATGGIVWWAAAGVGKPATPAETDVFPTTPSVDLGLRPWAQGAPYGPQERALATAAPALVFIEAVFTGYLRDTATKAPLRAAPIIFSRRCSGFVVSPDGYVLTSALCARPAEDSARQLALDTLARILVREKALNPKQVDSYIQDNMSKTEFTGADAASPPASQIHGQLNVAKGNLTEDPAILAELVDSPVAEAGNTVMVKLARNDLPSVELNASAEPAVGTSLLIVGFRTDDTDFRTASYRPQAKLVTVTGTGRRGALSISRLNDDVGGTSYGGMALDANGRVVGMLDQDEARPDRATRVVLPASSATGLLESSGVANRLGQTDQTYRAGLAAYYAGQDREAISQLETAAKECPTNLLADAYRQMAVERGELRIRPSGRPPWIVAVLAGLFGAAAVGLTAVVLVGRHR
ncbi:trypsin-like peptidase domain-containing protein [Plantactinospora sp. KBS50]|uniref:trypsin-like peptidase domain-containing protein n=1 Tax=Plantactinospora sp. KBS50 TaxID=2024580 RepID=UPI0012FD2A9E|nr:trypsin-like peptidase domain-containing protein [Plantactinospora sp. KBS50]